MNSTGGSDIYLGTMTGTSMDGIDLVAVLFPQKSPPHLLASQFTPYPEAIKQELKQLVLDPQSTITQMCQTDTRLGQLYAEVIEQFITNYGIDKKDIRAIGSHGQTIRHSIDKHTPYTLQIGDPNIIAARTGLTVAADFRRRDVALQGQGAPLAPAFHNEVFRSNEKNRVILNIGGIANITCLPADIDQPVFGFDTGPGNTLIDHMARAFFKRDYDHEGKLARSGKILHEHLLSVMTKEPYFNLASPKSTGTDYFSPQWLDQFGLHEVEATDALATLVEITAHSIADSIAGLPLTIQECFVCGGGAKNTYLLERLHAHLPDTISMNTTEKLGIHPDWVEATAFAWLAHRTLNQKPGNLPSVTNSKKVTILGAVYY